MDSNIVFTSSRRQSIDKPSTKCNKDESNQKKDEKSPTLKKKEIDIAGDDEDADDEQSSSDSESETISSVVTKSDQGSHKSDKIQYLNEQIILNNNNNENDEND